MEERKTEKASPLYEQAATGGARKVEEYRTGSVAKRSITDTESKATAALKAESEEDALVEGVDSDDLLEILDIMGMDDETEIMAKIPMREEDEDSESFQGLPGYSDDLANRKATPRSTRKGKDTMEEVEGKPRFLRLIKTCPYCGRLYSYRTDQPEPPTCGMTQCVAKHEESSKGKVMAK